MHWLYDNYIIALTDRNNTKVRDSLKNDRLIPSCAKVKTISFSMICRRLSALLLNPMVKLYQLIKSYNLAYSESKKLELLTDQQLKDIAITRYELTKKLRNISLGELEQEFDRKRSNKSPHL